MRWVSESGRQIGCLIPPTDRVITAAQDHLPKYYRRRMTCGDCAYTTSPSRKEKERRKILLGDRDPKLAELFDPLGCNVSKDNLEGCVLGVDPYRDLVHKSGWTVWLWSGGYYLFGAFVNKSHREPSSLENPKISISPYLMGNVHGAGDVCWGPMRPRDLKAAEATFWASGFNEDLIGYSSQEVPHPIQYAWEVQEIEKPKNQVVIDKAHPDADGVVVNGDTLLWVFKEENRYRYEKENGVTSHFSTKFHSNLCIEEEGEEDEDYEEEEDEEDDE